MPSRIELCKVADVPVGEVRRVEKAGLELAVYNLDDGSICVTNDHCTHGPGLMSEGFVEGDVIECNFHQGAYNIKTGEVVRPPCMEPIKTYKTIVDGDRVFIEVDTTRGAERGEGAPASDELGGVQGSPPVNQ